MESSVRYKADLHVHSWCSENPANPGIRALGGKESYTDPLHVYAAARSRGMDFVTITDHNTLAGSLAIAHLPGTFLSCEFDTWFPADDVKVHVVALGIDEATFVAADKARPSIFDLVACLREAGVVHFLAHPLYDMTGRLSIDHVEQLLLLFNTLEGRNGSRVDRCNELLEEIVGTLTPEAVEAMAERQGIEPWGETPWRKALTGGSDDHSGLFVAGAHTIAGGDGGVSAFLAAIAGGECAPAGEHGDARLLAHAIYAGSFHHIRKVLRLDGERPRRRAIAFMNKGFGGIGNLDVPLLEKAVSGVRACAPGLYRDGDPRGPEWEALLEREIGALLVAPKGLDGVSPVELNRRLFACARLLGDDVARHHLSALLAPERRLSRREKLGSAFGVGMVHFLELPYFIAWAVQSRDRAVQQELRGHFIGSPPKARKLAVFTDADTLSGDEEGESALMHARARERGVAIEMLTATPLPTHSADGVANFEALAVRRRRNGARCTGAIPSALEMLDYLEHGGFTAVHVSASGALGVAGAVAAKLLHLPVTGFADADVAHRSVLYRLVDVVFVPRREVANQLIACGVAPDRIRVLADEAELGLQHVYHAAVLEAALMRPPRRLSKQRRPRLRQVAAGTANAVQERA